MNAFCIGCCDGHSRHPNSVVCRVRVTLLLGSWNPSTMESEEMCKKDATWTGRKYFRVLISCVWQHRFSSEVGCLKWIEMKLYLWTGIAKVPTISIGWIAFLLSLPSVGSLMSFPGGGPIPRDDVEWRQQLHWALSTGGSSLFILHWCKAISIELESYN